MGDVIELARLGTPAVAVIADPFWSQSALVAASRDMPDVPRVRVPYPIAGTGPENIAAIARAVVGDVARALGL